MMRGLHYDIARGAYLRPAVFYDALRLAARSGFTHFFPYLENMIRLPAQRRACPPCAYTPTQWKTFERVAHAAGIVLVPHFNVIGHNAAADDPTQPATQEWTLRCLEEFCRFATGDTFLIGGDEWQAPPHVLKRGHTGIGTAWVDQINRAVELLARHGRQAVVWHDMLLHYPVVLEKLSRQATVAFWFYDEDSEYAALKLLRAHGFRTLMAAGMWDGYFSRRVARAVNCARRQRADGFLMTMWEVNRWETQQTIIPLVGAMLRGRQPPAEIVTALSLWQSLARLPAETEMAREWRMKLTGLLELPAWRKAPAHRQLLLAQLAGDVRADRASFRRYHFPRGPIFEKIGTRVEPSFVAGKTVRSRAEFSLTVEVGATLRFRNGAETFVVYPRLGGSLQDWRRGNVTFINHNVPALRKRGMPAAGGYNSYRAVGGLRVIWALGAHQNPNILWQQAYDWEVVRDDDRRKVVRLTQSLPHVTVMLTISMRRGRPGFRMKAEARNRLESAWGAFNFNLPLAVAGAADLEQLTLEWGRGRQWRLREEAESGVWLRTTGGVCARTATWKVNVKADVAGCFLDWGTGYITPDLHGYYRRLAVGDVVRTEWVFEGNQVLGEGK